MPMPKPTTGSPVSRVLPDALEALSDLALDLRWTWSHAADHLWRHLDADAWVASENPWLLLRDVAQEKIDRMAADATTVGELNRLVEARRAYLESGGWFGSAHDIEKVRGVAFFSMEFGLGEALPLYAGGLGVLAGDYLKAASDLGVPVVGVGLLYQEGYFRQAIDAQWRQYETYPYNDPTSLPIVPVLASDGSRMHVDLEFPGRMLRLRVWQAQVGRARLYLLDSNDPDNLTVDRGITSKLYGGDPDVQFQQEAVLGIGGWRVIDALGLDVEICHLNEGHAAFAVLERARCYMKRSGSPACSFREALWATRAGNVFTTHTAVPAAFDEFGPKFVERYMPYIAIEAEKLGITTDELLALGRRDPGNRLEPFNLAFLAMRGSASANGVSALHGDVSRHLFEALYPRWPQAEVPITHVTNGVHTPTWDSAAADRLWEARCGKDRWLGDLADAARGIDGATDDELWACRAHARQELVENVRARLVRQLAVRGADQDIVSRARRALDPTTLTLGLARRFTEYKRPALLLHDRERLVRLLTNRDRPVQLLVAGKAHPADVGGKEMIRAWVELAQDARVRDRLVFLEDYDLTLAQELVRGVDVWINTPRRPWEACGTSGMKVLVNGGLNVSVLDGWWAEAFSADVGWSIGDGGALGDEARDAADADQLYRVLESEVASSFYERNAAGMPTRWVARVRASMRELAPRFSANRMVREYVSRLYVPAAGRYRERSEDDASLARELARWEDAINRHWDGVRFAGLDVRAQRDGHRVTVDVELEALDPAMVQVELYADAGDGEPMSRIPMRRAASGDGTRYAVYSACVTTTRPASHFTPRVVPYHPNASVPAEASQVLWAR